MIAAIFTVSILTLFALLVMTEISLSLPLSPSTGLRSNDPDYLAAVIRDSSAYLTQPGITDSVRLSVLRMQFAAQQKLSGVKK